MSTDGESQASALIGTWEYMAPEQKRREPASIRSDLFAVGLMAYRILTGLPGLSLELPSELIPGLHPDWDSWIRKATSANPDRRFESAEAMREALPPFAPSSATDTPTEEVWSPDVSFIDEEKPASDTAKILSPGISGIAIPKQPSVLPADLVAVHDAMPAPLERLPKEAGKLSRRNFALQERWGIRWKPKPGRAGFASDWFPHFPVPSAVHKVSRRP